MFSLLMFLNYFRIIEGVEMLRGGEGEVTGGDRGWWSGGRGGRGGGVEEWWEG